MSARSRLVFGNWKMQLSAAAATQLAQELAAAPGPPGVQLGVFPSHPHLLAVGAATGPRIWLGAQDLDARPPGAVTGGVSAEQLRELGVRVALVGHSERRQLFAESNEHIAGKLRACLRVGLRPLLCLGERLEERRQGDAAPVVLKQLEAATAALRPEELGRVLLAYEPVWSIGTGVNAAAADVQEMHALLRNALRRRSAELAGLPIVYGGSVRPDNAADYFRLPDVDGALVGGASLSVGPFLAIARCCAEVI